uniref:Uncharacterized protein n=1 Tax=Anguilla anguilla TaxID=7936 RepID=A0A0E9XXZ7_ANGAN
MFKFNPICIGYIVEQLHYFLIFLYNLFCTFCTNKTFFCNYSDESIHTLNWSEAVTIQLKDAAG